MRDGEDGDVNEWRYRSLLGELPERVIGEDGDVEDDDEEEFLKSGNTFGLGISDDGLTTGLRILGLRCTLGLTFNLLLAG